MNLEEMKRKYAYTLARVGLNVQKGQTVLVEAAIEGSAFTPVFCEECYKLGASNVVVHYLDQANLKVASLYRSKEDVEKVEEAMLDLIMDYSSREGALEIDDENGYILQVKEEHMDIVEKLCPVELKPAVLRTLSVIALKEPIRQTDLKELRGSTAYEHVQELLDKGLISRTKDKNGRSYNLKTTPKFSEYFKLKGDTRSLAKLLEVDKGIKDND